MTTLYKDFSQVVTLQGAHQKDGRLLTPDDLSIINDGAVIFDDDKILWVGKTKDIPQDITIDTTQSFKGHALLPELVDSHTHCVFGGNRSVEYGMRLNGADYQDIAKAGGGILASMKGTNDLSRKELFELGRERIERILSYGVGTIEIKSGYGLNYEKEKELTEVIDELKKYFAPRVQIFNTFMAAHAVPKDYNDSHAYMQQVVIPLLQELAPRKIIDAVDIFHEEGYFDDADLKFLAEAATALKIPLKTHVDEFTDNKGAKLSAELAALSCDHLLCTEKDGIQALAKSKTVATLLPGTGFFLGKPQANARALLDVGVKVAIGSDYNPGSCNCDNLLLIASIAAPTYKMNLGELWAAITLNAAHALGLTDQGAILPGLKPRFSLFKVNQIEEITYNWGRNYSTSNKSITAR
ncbi:MAG: imidazolonepropionase [Deltaproteobacteria bacterium CG11_big_fil_rev_8_21_14_0_20_47_16]|nr:MAG: imidazolonepropionase [Deltaproteobacteria bacterium CG11_big_fil_rev_8_21_14_0_20_47_16]